MCSLLFLFDCNQKWNLSTNFSKKKNIYETSQKILQVWAQPFCAESLTDMISLAVTIQFANVLENNIRSQQ
jgi:hypothetical protein